MSTKIVFFSRTKKKFRIIPFCLNIFLQHTRKLNSTFACFSFKELC